MKKPKLFFAFLIALLVWSCTVNTGCTRKDLSGNQVNIEEEFEIEDFEAIEDVTTHDDESFARENRTPQGQTDTGVEKNAAETPTVTEEAAVKVPHSDSAITQKNTGGSLNSQNSTESSGTGSSGSTSSGSYQTVMEPMQASENKDVSLDDQGNEGEQMPTSAGHEFNEGEALHIP